MTPLEIFVSIVLLLLLIPSGWKIGKQISNRFSYDKDKKDAVLQDIKNALQDGLNSLNAVSMSPQEVKRLKIRKDKFLDKASQLISEIALISENEWTKEDFSDKLLGQSVRINGLQNMEGTVYFSDYNFAFSIIKNLIENTEFPKKEDYVTLNTLYKKYKKLNKENRNAK